MGYALREPDDETHDFPSTASPVVLVEDELALREILTIMLEDLGAVVTSFATAAEGLAALSTHDWASVLTDVRTPGPVDGLALQPQPGQDFVRLRS